ncbi:MAG: periplasmic heavy metal sensor [Chlorobium phaeobacteroides]|uniref:Periplasmic heavy metal sensor n=1 Tax=Chlorobium phaeobacteroides (strain BS1) TaxID=331678 RepID=B3EJ97_CHLPB|nr:periplasmic heavy metal sensor [Chlorobium phaeobacteroides]
MHYFQKRLIIAFLALIMLPMTTLQAKQNGPGRDSTRDCYQSDKGFAAGLNLTDGQIDLLKKNKSEKRKTMIKLRSDLRLLRVDMAEAASKPNPDMVKIKRISRKIGDVHARLTEERVRGIIYFRSVLNDEQRKILDQRRMQYGMKKGKRTRGHWR